MKIRKPARAALLRLEALESRLTPSAALGESFDTTTAGGLPQGWAQWSSTGGSAFAVSPARALSPSNGFAVSAPSASGLNARSWVDEAQPADVRTSAAVYLDGNIPAQVIARGSNLNTATPTYYAASVSYGLNLKLLRVVNGVSTTIGEIKSSSWFASKWASVTLYANGSNLRAQVYRFDTGQYLNGSGQWQTAPAWALNLTDTAIAAAGQVGLGRPASYTGTVAFDDFSFGSTAADTQAPTVTVTPPASGPVSGVTTVHAQATDNVGVTKAEFYVDGVLRAVDTTAPYSWDFDTTTAANGSHTVTVRAYDAEHNVGEASVTLTTQNDHPPLPRPDIPRHYSHIRIAQIAYNGGLPNLDASNYSQLRDSVDLVITDTYYANQIYAAAPDTPQMIYSNTSSVYRDLLTDWLAYADANGLAREGAFYHVAEATPFTGNGGSSMPVSWFWGVYAGGSTLSNVTSQARGDGTNGVAFRAAGQTVNVGYTERFREINIDLKSAASGGWSAVLEYPTAVDAAGNPTAWAPLTKLGDTTNGLTQSGRVLFDPPSDWKTASLGGSARLFYVRFRTVTGGTAPVARTILGRDYVNAKGTISMVIPAFDTNADANRDGYLDDAEYGQRAAGKDARFVYESRAFTYGPMRFVTNPSDSGFRSWAVDFHVRYLNRNPLAGGLFMDNSMGKPPLDNATVLEPVSTYGNDYGSLMYNIGKAIAPRWILANTAGGGVAAAPVVANAAGYFEEFGIRPMAHNFQQFEQLAGLVASRASLTSPSSYAIIDSDPRGGSPTDPRTLMGTLAYYYLLSDPDTTFLDFYGGYDTTGPWSRHWTPAAAYDVGLPTSGWSLFATGADPGNTALTYRVYQRSFDNALVLFKPLSFGNNVTGTLADNTSTTFDLGGVYYPLQADGTLGAPVTHVTLRNGEGAVLIKASAAVRSFRVTASPSAVAGSATAFTVTALDGAGRAITAYTGTVFFAATDVAAGLPASYTFTTADQGVHTFFANFKTAGTQGLTVQDTRFAVSGTRTDVAVKAAAASVFTVTAPSSATAGVDVRITVTAFDAYGNVATGYTGTVTFASSDSWAVLPSAYQFKAGDAGVRTFAGFFETAGNATLTVTDTKNRSITANTRVAVNPGAASVFVISGYPSPAVAGVGGTFTVTAQDEFGNVATGYRGTVTFSSSDFAAGLPASYAFTAADGGVHSFTATLKTAGTQWLTATDGQAGIGGTQDGIVVQTAAATRFVLTAAPAVTSDSTFSIKVVALDAYGNVATGYTGTVVFRSSEAWAKLPTPYAFKAGDAGAHTFSQAVRLRNVGSTTITVVDLAMPSLTSTITVQVNARQSAPAEADQGAASLLPTVESPASPSQTGTPSQPASPPLVEGGSSGAVSATTLYPTQPSTPGVFDPMSATWHLRDNADPAKVTTFTYGAPGWQAVVGSWTGNGVATPGVFDPTTANWYLRNSNSAGAPDVPAFQYGAPGWVPVVGDWDGNGTTTVGVVDPTTMTWYLRNSNSAGLSSLTPFQYGLPGWVPVVGDWDGNGTTGIGVFDPVTGTFYLRNDSAAGLPDFSFQYGGAGWTPVVGDWDGNGTATVGAVDPSTATWYLRNANESGAPDVTPVHLRGSRLDAVGGGLEFLDPAVVPGDFGGQRPNPPTAVTGTTDPEDTWALDATFAEDSRWQLEAELDVTGLTV